MKFLIGVLLMHFAAAICVAQESPSTPSDNSVQQEEPGIYDDQGNQDEGRYTIYDVMQMDEEERPAIDRDKADEQQAIPVPIQDQKLESIGAWPYVDDSFLNPRNRWGFSITGNLGYIRGINTEGQADQSSRIIAIAPRAFLNFGRRKSRLHLDAGAGYRRYKQVSALNSWDYFGRATYTNQLSRNVDFQLYDQFTSSYNDAWSFIALSLPLSYNPSFSNEVLFNMQRITRNSLIGNLNFRLTRKAKLGVFGAHRYYHYPERDLTSTNTYEAGASFDYQIAGWLHFASHYSVYLNSVDDRFRNERIHHLRVAGLDFHLSPAWKVWASGGVDYSHHAGKARFHQSINAGMGYTSEPTTFSVTYQRGLTSAIGLSTLLNSDVFSLLYGRRIISWMRGGLRSYYYRNHELSEDGLLRTFSAGGQLEFALSRNLVASLNGFYQNQNTRGFSISGLGLNRATVFVGIQYFWPSRSESGY